MTELQLKKVLDDVTCIIHDLRVLMDYVESLDPSLYRHFYMCWNKLCNVQSSGVRFLDDYKPFCFDSRNCSDYGFGCSICSHRPKK